MNSAPAMMNRSLGEGEQAGHMSSAERVSVKSLKFLLAGGINTIVFYIVYVLLIRLGWHYTLALLTEYAGGIVAGYYMNRYWTFVSHGRPEHGSIKYCVAYGIVFCLNLFFLGLIVELRILGPIPGQIVVIGIVSAISFLLQNFWVFHSTQNRG